MWLKPNSQMMFPMNTNHKEACQEILGCSCQEFIRENFQNLCNLFPKQPSSKSLKEYYCSDAYSAKLLQKLDNFPLPVEKRNEKLFLFLGHVISSIEIGEPKALCYGGHYISALLLQKKGFKVTCIDFPHKVFQIFKELFSEKINFIPLEDPFELDKFYDLIIASDVLEHICEPRPILKEFSEHMERGAILYAPTEFSDSFEHIAKLTPPSFGTIIQNLGFSIPFGKAQIGLFFKFTSVEYGIRRFRFTDKSVVGKIQRDTLLATINSIFQPAVSLNIGGPPGEFCRKSFAIDVIGKPHIRGEGERLPIKNNSVDLVYSCHSLEHMRDTRQALEEWIRVLKEGGLLVIIVPILPYHKHGKKVELGITCYEEHTEEEFKEIFESLKGVRLLQFGTRNNKTDLDAILKKT